MSLVDLTVGVHRILDEAGCDHAFGGALALGFVAEPRGTLDVDVNVFVPPEGIDAVIEAMGRLRLTPEQPLDQWMPASGLRFRPGEGPLAVDVFVSLGPVYDEVQRRCVVHPFGHEREPLPFLHADDLAVFKLSFGRPKDWTDLRAMASSVTLDLDHIERQALALRGPSMHPRVARLRGIARDASPGRGPA